jgi:hypothetical protein
VPQATAINDGAPGAVERRQYRGNIFVRVTKHQPGWFYYYYSMTHRQSDLVLAAGKTTDSDGASASRKIGDTIIKRIRRVRPIPEEPKKKIEEANRKD